MRLSTLDRLLSSNVARKTGKTLESGVYVPITPGLLNKTQAAYVLGVSRPTARRLIAEHRLEIVRVGALDYVHEGDVLRLRARAMLTDAIVDELAAAGMITRKQHRQAKRELQR
jgi:excisionase family DNA binding protein